MGARRAGAGVLVLLVGCSSSVAPGALDGAVGDAASDGGVVEIAPPEPAEPPRMPASPASPQLGPCLLGWDMATSVWGATACEPWSTPELPSCAPDELVLAGDARCHAVGHACPVGALPEGLPSGASVLHVLAAATAGGDGSAAAPFRTIGEALTLATTGTIVAVGRGTYDEAVTVPAGVTLRGACPAQTILTATDPTRAGSTVTVGGADVVVSDLSITGVRPGVLVPDGASATLEGIVISTGREGVRVIGPTGSAELRLSLIHDVVPIAGSSLGLGVAAVSGAHVLVDRCLVARTVYAGIAAIGGSTIMITNVTIADTRASPDVGLGRALVVEEGSHVEAIGLVVLAATEVGIGVTGNASVVLTDTLVRDTREAAGGGLGDAIFAADGARVTLRRVRLDGSRQAALFARDPGTRIEAEDFVISNTRGDADGAGGIGLIVQSGSAFLGRRGEIRLSMGTGVSVGGLGSNVTASDLTVAASEFGGVIAYRSATVELDRVLVDWAVLGGLGASDPGTIIRARDCVAQRIMPAPDIGAGIGASAEQGGRIELERAWIMRAHEHGALALGAGATLVLTDATFTDVLPREDGRLGEGIGAELGGEVTGLRVLVARATTAAVDVIGEGSRVTLTDFTARDIDADVTGSFGRGLSVETGGAATLTRALFERCRDHGIVISTGQLSATDVVVTDMIPGRDGQNGRALQVQLGSTAAITRLRIERARELAVAVAGGATRLVLEDAVVTDTLERACVGGACAEGAGIGLGVYRGASLEARRFVVTRSALANVQITDAPGEPASGLDLHEGEVSSAPIGANIQVPGYDFARLSDRVRYVDNERALDARTLAVPTTTADDLR